MIQWPDYLVKDLAARRAVIFFGSGVSRHSQGLKSKRPLTWWSFLDTLKKTATTAKKLQNDDLSTINRLLKENDLLTVCDILKKAIGREGFVDAVRDEFKTPKYIAAPIHTHIYKIDTRIVISPNFDEIYDHLARMNSQDTVSIKSYADDDIAECVRKDERVILKIHGSVSKANELIFTRSEYAEARNKHRNFYTLIESLLRTHTFLFIGCGLSDPDIRALLEDYSFSFNHSRKHYFSISNKELGKLSSQVIGDSLGLNFLPYSPLNNHKELADSLGNLVNLVDQSRGNMADSQSW
jgi:hypothetical protein